MRALGLLLYFELKNLVNMVQSTFVFRANVGCHCFAVHIEMGRIWLEVSVERQMKFVAIALVAV